MSVSVEELVACLKQRFEGKLSRCQVTLGQVTVESPARYLLDLCKTLREAPEFAFEQLMDLCGVDYSTYGHADWQTEEATRVGFSRGVDPAAYEERQADKSHFAQQWA